MLRLSRGKSEVIMPVDLLHTFPLSHEQAVETLLEAPWSPTEKKWIEEHCLATLFHPIGARLRRDWYLDNKTFPLPRHYMRRFSLGDSGDMSALIILNWLARIRGERFNLGGYVEEFRRQWLSKGIDPLTLEKIPRTK